MITHYQVGYISKNILIVCFVLIFNASFNLIFTYLISVTRYGYFFIVSCIPLLSFSQYT